MRAGGVQANDLTKPFEQTRWFDVVARTDACAEPPQVLLHAGPAYHGSPPVPVMQAAVQAVLYERLASSPMAARELIERGEIQLRPAQDHRIVTPLAQVVSASMPLAAVARGSEICYAPIIEGSAPAPALRFGSSDEGCRRRLREVGDWVGMSVAPRVRRAPVAIDALIESAVAAGEDCHAETGAMNAALITALRERGATGVERLHANPAFVLPILMAAAAAVMRSRRSSIEAIGGNGVDYGVRHRGETQWRRSPGGAPVRDGQAGADGPTPLPAIGDSAVIDVCGLGGQAFSAVSRRHSIIDPATGIVDAARVMRSALAPMINLAMLDRDGVVGFIGRGSYVPPLELFEVRPNEPGPTECRPTEPPTGGT